MLASCIYLCIGGTTKAPHLLYLLVTTSRKSLNSSPGITYCMANSVQINTQKRERSSWFVTSAQCQHFTQPRPALNRIFSLHMDQASLSSTYFSYSKRPLDKSQECLHAGYVSMSAKASAGHTSQCKAHCTFFLLTSTWLEQYIFQSFI